MIVILKKDVKGTGKAGDVVKVSDGYARNMLLPKGYAKEACLAVLDYGRHQLGVFHYQAWIQRENTVSQRFAAQLGFRKKEKACQGF